MNQHSSCSTSSIQQLFDSWAKLGKDERAAAEHSYAAFTVLDRLDWKPTDHYLDIGCGNGYTLRYVAPHLSQGSVTGIDLSPEMIAKAKKLTTLSLPVEFIQADLLQWEPQPHHVFEKIFSMEAFYYFSDVPLALRKTFSILAPNGVFACVIDYYEENEASHNWPSPQHCNVPMQCFSQSDWARMMMEAGLKEVKTERIYYPSTVTQEIWKQQVGSLLMIGHK